MKSVPDFYLFNSRIATHIIFWVGYYALFGLLWAGQEGYMASFYLEFVLLPIRILAVYATLYFLMPKFLLKRKYVQFLVGYMIMLVSAGILQRVFIHLFYEELLLNDFSTGLFSIRMLVRAMVLINTTVLFVMGVKLFQLWILEREKNERDNEKILELKANRRIHRVSSGHVLYIEGLGNYVTYHLLDNSKITVYGSIKSTLSALPGNFRRIHRSYIVNKDHIKSYDLNSVEVQNQFIPRGSSANDDLLLG
ncbi:LytTR family DNA-binding domain-containing protein [Ulvibacterium sp.]|uniref:LytR/AlgR family response regulator transcription factor n=1 Tax=Ulvibacterium sp. TaxID=2665914 RepID=UPI002610E280|nr:LytTR family DNA-binding domain-containing protein [Ulvibacterium sp.]